ncbi:response regulator [Clostridium sp. WB02_MRS01]|uniref:phosphorylase family protein n=1 Tax=Clostridium sp. WB02_MRS01 TaxID=2605777 RepID=UPI0012B34DB5|nr:response regulator [Clostridium sp. WB02_MRS01]MSS11270.1 response regulator [Clostridium sp. WB02_MRS01]
MKILIVDDENKKAQLIKSTFINSGKINEVDIEVATSINDAIEKMVKQIYRLMIIDMCLPNVFGSKLEEDGGLQLLKTIKSDNRITAPVDIIILTSHTKLAEKYKLEIEKESFDIINYDDSSEEWRNILTRKFNYILRFEGSPKQKREYIYDVAILTAVPVERKSVENLSENWEKVQVEGDSTIYYRTEWNKDGKIIKVITTSLTQMGMVSAATITSKIIYNFAPRYIVMTGIAAGVKDEYEIGDIIIPKEVKDYCSGKYTTPKGEEETSIKNPLKYFIPTAASISTSFDIINKVSENFVDELGRIHRNWNFSNKYKVPNLRTGYMASGDSVVQNSAVIDIMVKSHLRQADGLDMEAYGVYYASEQAILPKPTPICIKSISDFANKEKSDEHQEYAAYTSAQFAKYFIMTLI